MKRLLPLAFLTSSMFGQIVVVPPGGSPPSADTAAQIAAAIQTKSGCTTAHYRWVPASNTCEAPATGPQGPAGAAGATGATGPAGSDATVNATNVTDAIKTQTGCTTSGYVWSPQASACVAQTGGGGGSLPTNLTGVHTNGSGVASQQTYGDISAIQGTSPDTTQIDGTLKTGSGVDPSLPTAGHWLFALVPFSGVYHWGISEDGAAFRQIPTVSSAPSMIDLGWAESQDTAGTWSYFYGQGAPNIGSNPSTNMTNAPDAATYIPGDTALKGVEYYVQYNDCNKAKSSGSGGGGFPLQIQLYDATTSSLVTGTLASFAADVNFAHTPYIANPNVTLPAGHLITMQISLSGAGTGNCNLHAHAQIFY